MSAPTPNPNPDLGLTQTRIEVFHTAMEDLLLPNAGGRDSPAAPPLHSHPWAMPEDSEGEDEVGEDEDGGSEEEGSEWEGTDEGEELAEEMEANGCDEGRPHTRGSGRSTLLSWLFPCSSSNEAPHDP